MSGIMRAPSSGVYFSIPYSGKHVSGDCIRVATAAGEVSMVARYSADVWLHEDYITNFSDENNVISFKANYVDGDSSAAFIPGPNHV